METTYKSTTFKVTNTVWSLLAVSGKRNYISVRKESNNPFKMTGKEFKNIEEAVEYYKNPVMKASLLVAERSMIDSLEIA